MNRNPQFFLNTFQSTQKVVCQWNQINSQNFFYDSLFPKGQLLALNRQFCQRNLIH